MKSDMFKYNLTQPDSKVQILVWRLTIQTEIIYGFPQSLQADARIEPEIMP
jgi:hypothetical protein